MATQKPTLVWLAGYLAGVGGGQKLLFEGVEYFRQQGYRVVVLAWHFEVSALFNGHYTDTDIVVLNEEQTPKKYILKRVWSRLKSIFRVLKLLRKLRPCMVFVQSEYDVVVAYLLSFFVPFRYTLLIFGQMLQYADDMAKYAIVFRRHLETIVRSQVGYQQTISLKAPKIPLLDRWANELICLIRYFAVRNAVERFVFSTSVQWEVKLLYKIDSRVKKGAFLENIFVQNIDKEIIKAKYAFPDNKTVLLSMSRLQAKKRIEIMIEAMKYLSDKYVLCVAGSGDYRKELEAISQQNGVETRVRFLGHIPENDARALQSACDIFLSMDIGDYDIAPMEALALGTKVIVPTEFDLDDNLEKVPYLHVSVAHPEALARTIENLAKSKPEMNTERLRAYTWHNYFGAMGKYI